MDEPKNCFLCGQPLHIIRVGKRRLKYRAHRGNELDKCTAIHPFPNSLKVMRNAVEYMAKNKKIFQLQHQEDGRVMIHGDHKA